MWGIELKWFILFAVIIVVGGGIERRIAQLQSQFKYSFDKLNEFLGSVPPSMYSIKNLLSDIAHAPDNGMDYSTLSEYLEEIQNSLDTIKDKIVKGGA